jgi:MOSC domain-containing protein YiiM
MKVLSINLGSPEEIGTSRSGKVISAINKIPVRGSVLAKKLSLEGDHQADLKVHGGFEKAVYVYPSENYAHWQKSFSKLPWGSFGENLTTEGLSEETTFLGDRLLIGSAEFSVTRPRFPCSKLGLKFGTQKMVKLFSEYGHSGFYLKVLKEGKLKAGDEITLIHETNSESVADFFRRNA